MREWLAARPERAESTVQAAHDRWLAQFPRLAASDFGRLLAENSPNAREQAGWAPLRDFYDSELFADIQPRFQARGAALRSSWQAG